MYYGCMCNLYNIFYEIVSTVELLVKNVFLNLTLKVLELQVVWCCLFASPQEKMPIPSVVIEPASSNEGDDDRDGDITSPIATGDNGMIAECQTTKDSSEMPPRFLYKVKIKTTLHYITYIVAVRDNKRLVCNNEQLREH